MEFPQLLIGITGADAISAGANRVGAATERFRHAAAQRGVG